MNRLWDEELTEDQANDLIEKAVHEIRRRHMEVPAVLMLETHRPLGYVGSQAMIAFSPFLIPFFGFDRINDWSRLIANRAYVDRLIKRLEEPEQAVSEGAA